MHNRKSRKIILIYIYKIQLICRIFEKKSMNFHKCFFISKKFIFITTFLIFNFSFLIPMKDFSQQTGMYFKVEVRKHVTLETNFLLYLPEGYDTIKQKWPLLLFLHGAGEQAGQPQLPPY